MSWFGLKKEKPKRNEAQTAAIDVMRVLKFQITQAEKLEPPDKVQEQLSSDSCLAYCFGFILAFEKIYGITEDDQKRGARRILASVLTTATGNEELDREGLALIRKALRKGDDLPFEECMKLGADDARTFFKNREQAPLGLTKLLVTDIRLSRMVRDQDESVSMSDSDDYKLHWSVVFQAAVWITKKEEVTEQVSPPTECKAFVDGLCAARKISLSDQEKEAANITVQAIRGSAVIRELMDRWDEEGQPSFTDQDIQRASQTLQEIVSSFKDLMRREK